MRVVIDTNVLINCISSRTRYHAIWQGFLTGEITLCASTDVLLEYEELVLQKYPLKIASDIIDILLDPDYVRQQDIYIIGMLLVLTKMIINFLILLLQPVPNTLLRMIIISNLQKNFLFQK